MVPLIWSFLWHVRHWFTPTLLWRKKNHRRTHLLLRVLDLALNPNAKPRFHPIFRSSLVPSVDFLLPKMYRRRQICNVVAWLPFFPLLLVTSSLALGCTFFARFPPCWRLPLRSLEPPPLQPWDFGECLIHPWVLLKWKSSEKIYFKWGNCLFVSVNIISVWESVFALQFLRDKKTPEALPQWQNIKGLLHTRADVFNAWLSLPKHFDRSDGWFFLGSKGCVFWKAFFLESVKGLLGCPLEVMVKG